MIRLRDSLTLALTKLRTRKVRLVVTVIVSGLLFCGLAAASFIARGAFKSIDDFNKDGFGKRYIVQGYYNQNFPDLTDTKLIDRTLELQKDLIARKKAAAKTLGIEYDATQEPTPVQEYDTGAGKQRSLDYGNVFVRQAVKELQPQTIIAPDVMTKLSAPYGSTHTYESRQFSPPSDGATLQVIKNGKENFDLSSNQSMNGPPTGTDSFTSFWSLMSADLMKPFVLQNASLENKGDGVIPIIVPVNAAEQLLGMKELPASAKTEEKLTRMKELRSKAASITFQVCYRNGTSSGLINNALTTAREIEQNKKNKDYQKPELIYGLPALPCAPVGVTRDARDADEKKLAAKEEQFATQFGKQPAAEQVLQFRVVGMSPNIDYGAAFGVTQIVSSLVTSSLGSGWYTPAEFQTTVPLLSTLFADDASGFSSPPSYYAEFTDANVARKFIETENCAPDFSVGYGPGADVYANCRKDGKNFSLMPFGSNSLALDSAKRGFSRIFGVIALVAAVIAAVIMMGTVGRMIADSRRETAVFRAIGAKRIDIAQVYVLYTVLLALLISLFALTVGLIVATLFQQKFSPVATVQALVAYNAQDLSRQFGLLYVYPQDMIRLVGLIFAASIVSSFLPLLRNLRRNPIRDMRDDT